MTARLLSAMFIVFALTATSCTTDHLITDKNLRERVERDFTGRMEYLGDDRAARLVSFVADGGLTPREREALWFLLAYSPLCDIADCEPDYFLRQARGALRAREYFGWGMSIPEDVFMYFVLPFRVNNENPDEARDVFFEDLRDRIDGMSMYDAALEVNHWCHEKVEYRATDSRTSSPLALVKTSWGRCGEESAFTAAALRAVGIPARQVYTPRWVHTDSNHAWVEVWIDGRWRYLGACEPEPELDMAWFTVPATRAMMMHTTVPGPYDAEEVNSRTAFNTTLNLTDKYAPVRTLDVRVEDRSGDPVAGAEVKFKVYNYSELFPVATKTTGPDGSVSLTTGYGDLVVWATRGDEYGYLPVTPGVSDAVVVLNGEKGRELREIFIMNPPAGQPVPAVETAKAAENRRRLAAEDSIRNAYMSTFPQEGYARALAGDTGLDGDKVWHFIRTSQGNWEEIERFIRKYSKDPYLLPFLGSLTEKDLRDTPGEYLEDHFTDDTGKTDPARAGFLAANVLSPRIGMEKIAPWRSYLRESMGGVLHSDPEAIARHVKENIRVDDSQNYVACVMSPAGVHRSGLADRRSRDTYFVALCRTAGIPARIERSTGKPQFFHNDAWQDALLDAAAALTAVPETGMVIFASDQDNRVVPAYRTHYTIARFENGDFRTVDLAGELAGKPYPVAVRVPTGYYRLIIGSRANDGSVAVDSKYFNVEKDGRTDINLSFAELEDKLFVEGILDMNTIIFLPDGTKTTLKEQSNDKGLIVVFVDPATEPSRHILQEMPTYADRLDEWGGGVLFVEQEELSGVTFNRSVFGRLPAGTVWMTDNGRALLGAAAESLRIQFSNEFPLTLYLNDSGGILFSHKGYRLGLVESIYKTIEAEARMK